MKARSAWGSGRRGSTLILVLAFLSILTFLIATLAFTSRMESTTSRNFARLTQARTSAATGLPAGVFAVSSVTSVTALHQAWNTATPVAARAQNLRQRAGQDTDANAPGAIPEEGVESMTDLQVVDLSGRVNVNTVRDRASFERFLQAVFNRSQASNVEYYSRARAAAVIKYRSANGETTTTDADLRQPPAPGQNRFETVAQLSADAGRGKSLFTEAELDVLAPYLTTFSQAPEVFVSDTGTSFPKLSLKEFDIHRLLAALEIAFPDADPRLRLQFAANVADRLDADAQPTVLDDPDHPEPWHRVFGAEDSPLISEVYPDSATPSSGGDRGQFLEIRNPTQTRISVDGWQLVPNGAGLTTVPGAGIALRGMITPGGALIITDNYDQAKMESEPGTGSFLAVFGAKADSESRRVLEDPSFNLQDRNAFVSLYDADGHLVDTFFYTELPNQDSKKSFQREDPWVRGMVVAEATPFNPFSGEAGAKERLRYAVDSDEKKPLEFPVDLLSVSTAYAGLKTTGNQRTLELHPWQTPEFAAASLMPDTLKAKPEESTKGQASKSITAAGGRTNLDLRVVDLFTSVEITTQSAETAHAEAEKKKDARTAREIRRAAREAAKVAADEAALAEPAVTTSATLASETPVLFSYGKLNLNTCDPVAVQSLSLSEKGRDDKVISDLTKRLEQRQAAGLQKRVAPFRRISEVYAFLFKEDSPEHRGLMKRLEQQVTLSSSAFEIRSSARDPFIGGGGNDKSGPPAATPETAAAQCRWVISMDTAPVSVVTFQSIP